MMLSCFDVKSSSNSANDDTPLCHSDEKRKVIGRESIYTTKRIG